LQEGNLRADSVFLEIDDEQRPIRQEVLPEINKFVETRLSLPETEILNFLVFSELSAKLADVI
jgi:hypothetical protein